MKALSVLFFLFFMMWGCTTCIGIMSRNSNDRVVTNSTDVTIAAKAADGLELQALGELVKASESAEDLERSLNSPGGPNNMDLNEDGEVDFIKVTEYGNDKDQFGFSLTTEVEPGQEQEVATIEIDTSQETTMEVAGNQQIYGNNNYHRSSFGGGASWLIMGYLLGSAMPYRSPWGYNSYPTYYSRYRTVPYPRYRDTMSSTNYSGTGWSRSNTSTVHNRSTISSPNQGKTAATGVRAPLAQPTSAQRSFQARNPSKSVRSGGFGRSTSGSVRNSSSSSRGFGGRGK